MDATASDFRARVGAIVTRFYLQNARVVPSVDEVASFAQRLAKEVARRGLPAPLAQDDPGTPGGLAADIVDSIAARVAVADSDSFGLDLARQLVKACFYPEFTVCRDSYRECGRDGACRRQDVERARRRVSGSHCVDCPYWVALEPMQHETLLEAEWHGDAGAFRAHQSIFLPEDFRALRRWVHSAMRSQG